MVSVNTWWMCLHTLISTSTHAYIQTQQNKNNSFHWLRDKPPPGPSSAPWVFQPADCAGWSHHPVEISRDVGSVFVSCTNDIKTLNIFNIEEHVVPPCHLAACRGCWCPPHICFAPRRIPRRLLQPAAGCRWWECCHTAQHSSDLSSSAAPPQEHPLL